MKTEQEQINKLASTIYDIINRENTGRFVEDKNGNLVSVETVGIEGIAEALIKAGYGNVFEYKAEIERLKAENKQAQIETINTIVKYCENPNHWRKLKDCKLWGGKSNDLRDFLNGIFKEAEDNE